MSSNPSRKARTCPWCGAIFDATCGRQRTCSRACSRAKPKMTRVYIKDCTHCGAVFCTRNVQQRYCKCAGYTPAPDRLVTCKDCGHTFMHQLNGKPGRRPTYCQPCAKHRDRTLSYKARAEHHGVGYTPINRRLIYQRDAWTCGICGDAVDPTITYPDLMCASLDHVVAMVNGGDHVPSNVQCAHFLCNSLKGDQEIHFKVA